MSFLRDIFAGDDSRGKKSDDRTKPANGPVLPTAWSAKRGGGPGPSLRRRIIYILLGLTAIYLFVKNLPTDLGPPPGGRPSFRDPGPLSPPPLSTAPEPEKPVNGPQPPPNAPPRAGESTGQEEHYFNGKIRFYKLAASLHTAASAGTSDNILFAVSSLRSAANVLPLACAMKSQKRNSVHFMFMGRNDMDVEEIREVNGLSDDCDITWHDGRPDYSRWSSDYRMEVSVAAGLGHFMNFIEPTVVVTDGSGVEDAFFTNSIRRKTNELGRPIIELPSDAVEKMMWISRLDSGSLSAWSTTYVEILIHAPRESSGSLIRLLKSIEEADYFNYRRPHLTIELPEVVDDATWQYLQQMTWPPLGDGGTAHQSQVTLRHRIPRGSKNSLEAAAHVVESFYPARVLDSNVLVLSPQVELSPLYYHYLMYALLEYKYSESGRGLEIRDVVGISLDLPGYYLNDSQIFTPPTIFSTPSGASSDTSKSEENTPFLWQAPNSNAALYFGDKWLELHSFLTRRLAATKMRDTPMYHKQITDKYPLWLEFLLELMRARGYTMIYPSFGSNGVVTVHNELYQEPDENWPKRKKKTFGTQSTSNEDLDPSEPFTVEPSDFPSVRSSPSEKPLISSDLLSLFPDSSGPLPGLTQLPLLSYQGNSMNAAAFTSAARNYAKDFRREVGHCSRDGESLKAAAMSAADLFCEIPGFFDESDDNENAAFQDAGEEDPDTPVNPNPETPNSRPLDANTVQRIIDEYVPPPPPPDKADSSENTQNEFEAHLRRQAASAGSTMESKEKSGTRTSEDDAKPLSADAPQPPSNKAADSSVPNKKATSDPSVKEPAKKENKQHPTQQKTGDAEGGNIAPGGNEKGNPAAAGVGKAGGAVDPRKVAVKGGDKSKVTAPHR